MAHDGPVEYGPMGIPMHYLKVWIQLTVLFLISFFGAIFARDVVGGDLGFVLLLLTAFGIAMWKAWLVIAKFMHLPMEKKVLTYIQVTTLALMFLFFFAVAPDVMNHHGTNWENRAAIESVERGNAEGKKAEQEGGGHH